MENHFEICMTEDQLRGISSIGLAHMGDAVFELLVRGWLCQHGKATGKGLHQATIQLVRAEHQAACAEKILPLLTEAELAVFRRGRNAQVHSVPQPRQPGPVRHRHGPGGPARLAVPQRPAAAGQRSL